MPEHDVVLYGATGYTGRLIAHELDKAGVAYAVAGRDLGKLETLSKTLDARPPVHAVDVDDPVGMERLAGQGKVLLSAAGPYVHTGPRALAAAISAGAHFVDITGEQTFLRHSHGRDSDAVDAGVTVVNAMGFDVVPSELAAVLACRDLDDVARLDLCIAGAGGMSRGTLKSMAASAGHGWWYDRGRFKVAPPGRFARNFDLPAPLGTRAGVFIPWGDCITAPRSTGADRVRTFFTMPANKVRTMHLTWGLTGVMAKMPHVRRSLAAKAAKAKEGPSTEARVKARWVIQGEAVARDGTARRSVVSGKDAYGMTGAASAAGAVALSRNEVRQRGVLTPSQAFDLEVFAKGLGDFDLAWRVV